MSFSCTMECPIVLLFVGFSSPAQTHMLQLKFDIPIEDVEQMTALGSVGIEFGNTAVGGKIEPVKYACCAKIISVV